MTLAEFKTDCCNILRKIIHPSANENRDRDLANLHDQFNDSIEQMIRDDFDHFDDAYLRGVGNRLMRQRTNRLCEEVVRHVMFEIK